MSLGWYPICLNILNKKVVVIGGGAVAERKVGNLLECGAKVTVVSPEISKGLKSLVAKEEIIYIKSVYSAEYVLDAYLLYAVTSDGLVNKQIASDAEKYGVLVNVCDSLEQSAFILPAVLRTENTLVAISTEGKSPARAVAIRDKLKENPSCIL